MGELLPLVTIVLLSLTLGNSLKDLGTGVFVAGVVGEYLPVVFIVPMLLSRVPSCHLRQEPHGARSPF